MFLFQPIYSSLFTAIGPSDFSSLYLTQCARQPKSAAVNEEMFWETAWQCLTIMYYDDSSLAAKTLSTAAVA